MKLNCGLSKEEQNLRLQQWHTWFAWFPVRVGYCDCRWLETVERKGYSTITEFWKWEYRATPEKKP